MYQLQTRVGYSQLSPEGRLSLTALLDLFQDCATLHGEDFGLGLSVLTGRGQAWLLSRCRVRFYAPMPVMAQPITVQSQAFSCRMSLLTRRYWLRDETGVLLAEGEALWVLTDIETHKPIPALSGCETYLEPGDFPPLAGLPHRLRPAAGAVPQPPISITRDLLDTNRHCNNVRAVGVCSRYLPEDFRFSAFAADYHLPLLPQAVVIPQVSRDGDGVSVALTADGKLCMLAAFVR